MVAHYHFGAIAFSKASVAPLSSNGEKMVTKAESFVGKAF
jgi:hypothetical protein